MNNFFPIESGESFIERETELEYWVFVESHFVEVGHYTHKYVHKYILTWKNYNYTAVLTIIEGSIITYTKSERNQIFITMAILLIVLYIILGMSYSFLWIYRYHMLICLSIIHWYFDAFSPNPINSQNILYFFLFRIFISSNETIYKVNK